MSRCAGGDRAPAEKDNATAPERGFDNAAPRAPGRSVPPTDDKQPAEQQSEHHATRASDPPLRAASAEGNRLVWREVECHVSDSSNRRKEVTLLRGLAGEARSGDLVAVIGPSGAGKTTLLDVLAQRKTIGRLGNATTITYNGHAVDAQSMQELCAYVMQQDSFHPTITTMEALLFHAHMKLPASRSIPLQHKIDLGRKMLRVAGLQGKEDARVGGQLSCGVQVRGLSGGERRRLSLCCGAISSPAILFCDEVTSGLDSRGALEITRMLHAFATERRMAVVATVHQPRHSIWRLFSKVVVMSKGRQLFFGTPAAAESWFTRGLGLTVPPETSPADFIVDQANVDFDDAGLSGPGEQRGDAGCNRAEDGPPAVHAPVPKARSIGQMADCFRAQHPAVFAPAASLAPSAAAGPPAGGMADWWFKYRVLLQRTFWAYVRNPGNMLWRSVFFHIMTISGPLTMEGIGRRPGPNTTTNLLGAIYENILGLYLCANVVIPVFLYDRTYFIAERGAGLYPPAAYFLAMLTLEFLVNGFNGAVYAFITYHITGHQTYFGIEDSATAAAGFVGIMTIASIVIHAQALFFTLLSPSFEIAHFLSGSYAALATVFVGFGLTINPDLSGFKYLSLSKYSFDALVLLLFGKSSPHVRTPWGTFDEMLHTLRLGSPPTVYINVLASILFYLLFAGGGFLCLHYGTKERR